MLDKRPEAFAPHAISEPIFDPGVSTVQTIILSLHVLVCVILVVLVLLQSGKEGMGVIFGGGNSSVFGSSGAGGLLAKLTAFLAILFVITSLSYNYATSSRTDDESSILDVRLEDMPRAPAAPKTSAVPAPSVPAAPAPAEPAAPQTPQAPAANNAPAPVVPNPPAPQSAAPEAGGNARK